MNDLIIHEALEDGRRQPMNATVVVREKILIALMTVVAAAVGTWITYQVAFAEVSQQVKHNSSEITNSEARTTKAIESLKLEFRQFAKQSADKDAATQRSIGKMEGTLEAILKEVKK